MKSSPASYGAITGDSKLLAVVGHAGQLVRLFWPHIDHGQHIEEYRVAIGVSGKRHPIWLDSSDWKHAQHYVEGTNVIQTTSVNKSAGLTVESVAFSPAGRDCLVLDYRIHRKKPDKSGELLRFFLYERLRINETPYYTAAFFDEESGALVFYFRDTCVATISTARTAGFQCNTEGVKHGAVAAIEAGSLNGNRIEHKLPEAAVSWNLDASGEGGSTRISIVLAGGASTAEAIERAKSTAALDIDSLIEESQGDDLAWLGVRLVEGAEGSAEEEESRKKKRAAKQPHAGTPGLVAGAPDRTWRLDKLASECGPQSVNVFLRSLLAIKLLSDRQTGAIIAAPEFDREREMCGGYGYVWGRDGAFNAYALDLAGIHPEAEAFYRYAKRVQEPSGVWRHRHCATGELAQSWGLIQIDETGAILWGISEHYSFTNDREFLTSMWDSVERGANYLCHSIDEETGLPLPSFDLWEENCCESVYAAAAVYGGLEGAARCADILGRAQSGVEWRRVADQVRDSIPKQLWNKKRKSFSRSRKRIVSEETFTKDAKEKSDGFYVEAPEKTLYPVFYQAEDATIDSSLLGLTFPFKAIDVGDEKMRQSALAVKKHLWWKKTGGLFRYEGDTYVGGNPWILTTLWLAIYYLEAGERGRAIDLIKWAADQATETGLLTEQVDKKTGKPIWAVPLGWSHAMFIIASLMLMNSE